MIYIDFLIYLVYYLYSSLDYTYLGGAFLDFDTSTPIYLQVIQQIKREIISGILVPGDKLPSTRELALKYDINPNTAQRIYKEMEREAMCYTKRGLGTFVTEDEGKVSEIREEMANALINDFVSGMLKLGYTYDHLLQIIKKRKVESEV